MYSSPFLNTSIHTCHSPTSYTTLSLLKYHEYLFHLPHHCYSIYLLEESNLLSATTSNTECLCLSTAVALSYLSLTSIYAYSLF